MNTADFSLRHIGPREADQKQMLQTIGVDSMEQLIHEKEKTTQLKEQITQLHELICEMRTELVQSRPYSNDLHESENSKQIVQHISQ